VPNGPAPRPKPGGSGAKLDPPGHLQPTPSPISSLDARPRGGWVWQSFRPAALPVAALIA
jgi:hypothetical protein